jgi:hypothetical protein
MPNNADHLQQLRGLCIKATELRDVAVALCAELDQRLKVSHALTDRPVRKKSRRRGVSAKP